MIVPDKSRPESPLTAARYYALAVARGAQSLEALRRLFIEPGVARLSRKSLDVDAATWRRLDHSTTFTRRLAMRLLVDLVFPADYDTSPLWGATADETCAGLAGRVLNSCGPMHDDPDEVLADLFHRDVLLDTLAKCRRGQGTGLKLPEPPAFMPTAVGPVALDRMPAGADRRRALALALMRHVRIGVVALGRLLDLLDVKAIVGRQLDAVNRRYGGEIYDRRSRDDLSRRAAGIYVSPAALPRLFNGITVKWFLGLVGRLEREERETGAVIALDDIRHVARARVKSTKVSLVGRIGSVWNGLLGDDDFTIGRDDALGGATSLSNPKVSSRLCDPKSEPRWSDGAEG